MASRIVHPPVQVGDRFGLLVVTSVFLKWVENSNRNITYCSVLCDCGRTVLAVRKTSLQRGDTKSCSCLKGKHKRKRKIEDSQTSTLKAFLRAKYRCSQKNIFSKKYYAEKNITFKFEKVEDLIKEIGLKPKDHQLDRIDNKKGYEPGNVRWVSKTENMRNTSASKFWYVDGIRYESMREAAKLLSVSPRTIVLWCNGGTAFGRKIIPKSNCWSEKKYK